MNKKLKALTPSFQICFILIVIEAKTFSSDLPLFGINWFAAL